MIYIVLLSLIFNIVIYILQNKINKLENEKQFYIEQNKRFFNEIKSLYEMQSSKLLYEDKDKSVNW
jgi:hypothetical protein